MSKNVKGKNVYIKKSEMKFRKRPIEGWIFYGNMH